MWKPTNCPWQSVLTSMKDEKLRRWRPRDDPNPDGREQGRGRRGPWMTRRSIRSCVWPCLLPLGTTGQGHRGGSEHCLRRAPRCLLPCAAAEADARVAATPFPPPHGTSLSTGPFQPEGPSFMAAAGGDHVAGRRPAHLESRPPRGARHGIPSGPCVGPLPSPTCGCCRWTSSLARGTSGAGAPPPSSRRGRGGDGPSPASRGRAEPPATAFEAVADGSSAPPAAEALGCVGRPAASARQSRPSRSHLAGRRTPGRMRRRPPCPKWPTASKGSRGRMARPERADP